MHTLSHFALFLTNTQNKKKLIQQIIDRQLLVEMKGKKVAVFSEILLKEAIEYEARFGSVSLMENTNRHIASLSGGEQRKVLLNYCLSQNPDLLILDDPFDHLDIKSQKNLRQQLIDISKQISIIQLVNRQNDLLPFIEFCLEIGENDKVSKYSKSTYLSKLKDQKSDFFIEKIPEPYSSYCIDYEHIVKFNSVTISYESITIIKNITWEIKPNQFWQLVGPNGAGKTTILSMIIGDNPKAFGQNISLFGKQKGSGESVWEIKKQIGYFSPSMMNLFARNTNPVHMIVSGIFDSIGLYQIPSERHLRLASQWLKLLGFEALVKTPFHLLTMGQQRLIMIARAMIKHPPLLILDEPTTGLDDHNALVVSYLINKIAKESTTAIIYVSHRQEPGLRPDLVYELTPDIKGSIGKIKPQIA